MTVVVSAAKVYPWFISRRGAEGLLSGTRRPSLPNPAPRTRRLSKLDLARFLNAWSDLPFRVCRGGQKNFQHFMQRLKDRPQPPPDEAWFRGLIAIGIIYRAAERIVRQMAFPAFRSQIVAYLIASLSRQTGGGLDFEELWRRQAVSPELEELLRSWTPHVNDVLRSTARPAQPRLMVQAGGMLGSFQTRSSPSVGPDPARTRAFFPRRRTEPCWRRRGRAQTLSVEDFDRIHHCMEVDSATLLQAAELGQRERVLHWKTAGILRTLAGYAAGGWEKKPSVKQARFALDALQAVRDAGLLQTECHEEKETEERRRSRRGNPFQRRHAPGGTM